MGRRNPDRPLLSDKGWLKVWLCQPVKDIVLSEHETYDEAFAAHAEAERQHPGQIIHVRAGARIVRETGRA